MSLFVDNMIAYRIIHLLVTPITEFDAYRLGVVDQSGKMLIKPDNQTPEQKGSFSYLTRLVLKMKRMVANVPGGSSLVGSYAAALLLISEANENNSEEISEERFNDLISSNVFLVDESLLIEEYATMTYEDIANITGSAVSTDQPVVRLKNGRPLASFAVGDHLFRRFANGKKKDEGWEHYLNLENEYEKRIYDYATQNPDGVLLLKNGKEIRSVRFNRQGGGAS